MTVPPGVAEVEALGLNVEARRQCALGFHAWVPWLAVHYPSDVRGGEVSYYTTWCAREGCDHTEHWDRP